PPRHPSPPPLPYPTLFRSADTRICDADNVPTGWMILDIGPSSRDSLASVLARAGTIVWNGPVGVFELDAFAAGTRALAEAIAARDRKSTRLNSSHVKISYA